MFFVSNRLNIIVALLMCFSLTVLSSCEKETIKEDIDECNEDPNLTNIRILNDSDLDYEDVLINPNGVSKNYGDIAKGETTCYRTFDKAYSYAYVQLFVDGEEYVLQPIDFVGETPLGIGKFTYTITVDEFGSNGISIVATPD